MQIHEVGGRELRPESLESAIEAAAVREAMQQMTAGVSLLRCPKHHRAPRLEFEGDSLQSLKVTVRACCEASRELAVEALKQ